MSKVRADKNEKAETGNVKVGASVVKHKYHFQCCLLQTVN